MGYRLQAAIATETVLRALADPAEDVRIVPLGQHLSLLPMTDALFDAVTVVGAPQLDGFWKAPAGFGRTLADCSANGPVAYVEAEYFGGAGEQSAMVWDVGQVVLSYLHLVEKTSVPAVDTPISRALRRLGVTKGDHQDEFDAVGLGRHRDTEDWLSSTS
ncbi:hypothetical protein F0L68_31605 [Solihabitans fulvus]|uniref:Uncharacterized protein n=1 Tax=Solihabitans fulvus TaxID=1892852 RepID=A0A5B2WSZ1_9PSEU|nr:hypothetical protein [Solihabitans fulvus]KAA2253832.1 hypothetical protein F0L68_31605 [Solihabitans fulvus]